jgi:hypothetical protein
VAVPIDETAVTGEFGGTMLPGLSDDFATLVVEETEK